MRRVVTTLAVTATMVLSAAGTAMAHERGEQGGGGFLNPPAEAGEPNCFGQRNAHASSQHGLNPKARAANIQRFIDTENPFQELLQGFYGDTVEIREMMTWIRTQCSDDPIFP